MPQKIAHMLEPLLRLMFPPPGHHRATRGRHAARPLFDLAVIK